MLSVRTVRWLTCKLRFHHSANVVCENILEESLLGLGCFLSFVKSQLRAVHFPFLFLWEFLWFVVSILVIKPIDITLWGFSEWFLGMWRPHWIYCGTRPFPTLLWWSVGHRAMCVCIIPSNYKWLVLPLTVVLRAN